MATLRIVLPSVCLSVATLGAACGASDRSPLGARGADAAVADGSSTGVAPSEEGGEADGGLSGVDAAPATYGLSGIVTGLRGAGLVLTNGFEDVVLAPGNGAVQSFAFPTKLAKGTSYTIAAKFQPTGPVQVCAVTGGSGTLTDHDVTDVEVACETVTYAISGNVLGLAGSGLVLQNNLGDDLPVAPTGGDAGAPSNVSFSFQKKVESGAGYDVRVLTQPSNPTQTCDVSGGKGSVVAGDVSSVTVNCLTSSFTVGGTVTGLQGTGLKLKLGADGDEITVSSTDFTFPALLKSGSSYSVSVIGQPTGPWQNCDVDNASGVVGGGNVTSVTVKCTTLAYSIGGNVTGLLGSGLKLKNGTEEIAASLGPFTFTTKVPSGQGYSVTPSVQPTSPWQECKVTGGVGQVQGADVSTVDVACSTLSFAVKASVTGLVGAGLKLKSGTTETPVATNTVVTFPSVASGAAYGVTVTAQPVGSICSAGAGGTMQGAEVTVPVTCTTGTVLGGTSTAASLTVPANVLLARKVTLPTALNVMSVGGYWSDPSCSVKYALYRDTAGAPGQLAASTGVVITTAGASSEALLTAPTALAAGDYWLALVLQSACHGDYAPSGGTGYVTAAGAFASPFPATFPANAPGGAGFDVSMFLRGVP